MVDPGREFENRALALARAIHDPLGLQGARMVLGKERDAVFVDDSVINAYEFTTDRSKKKAEHDGGKLVEVLEHLGRDAANTFKAKIGWFVTQHEPTADQREVIRKLSKTTGVTLHSASYVTLRKRLCDVEGYLAARLQAPFGSIAYAASAVKVANVPPRFQSASGTQEIAEVSTRLSEGANIVLTGEFGVGKSHAMREIFMDLRKKHFKNPATTAFPIHINLRDCVGLRTPAEILRRHAEEIGFSGDKGLMSAWRAGSVVLLLDGFDEVIPSRWLGSAANLRQIRWEALSVVRRFVTETPTDAGVLLAGRGHYFASEQELRGALGVGDAEMLLLEDFDAEQALKFLQSDDPSLRLPDWLPTRPLLLSHLFANGLLAAVAGLSPDLEPSGAWRSLLEMISHREANIYTSVPPDTIAAVLRRLATVARRSGDKLGRLNIGDLERVFTEVSGRATDEEVLQLLLRLPGLALGQSGGEEFRLFADQGLSAAGYGEDLASYLSSPYQGHPLCDLANWSDSAEDLAIEVCASALRDLGISSGQVAAACEYRMSRHQYDAVLLDGIRVGDELGGPVRQAGGYLVEGVAVESLVPSADAPLLGRTHIRDGLIESVDLSQADSVDALPTLERCFIASVEGVSELPSNFGQRFVDCEIESFDAATGTTSGILAIEGLDLDDRIALSVLHKVYAKRGSGRKDTALRRGIDPSHRDRVADVIDELVSASLLVGSSRGGVTIYRPAKGRGSEVARYLASPASFRLGELK